MCVVRGFSRQGLGEKPLRPAYKRLVNFVVLNGERTVTNTLELAAPQRALPLCFLLHMPRTPS
jgi:hypothetical protein